MMNYRNGHQARNGSKKQPHIGGCFKGESYEKVYEKVYQI